jgi:putative nucleotidyltransferase with HDIG domain
MLVYAPMEPMELNNSAGRENVRRYFQDVVKSHKLPALPVVAAKILDMIQDPDVNVQKLCRLLSDDAALAGRVLAVSRSPLYAQRNLPTTSIEAVQVLGLRTLTNVILANSMHSLHVKGHKNLQKLWNHSLAVALAARILCRRIGLHDGDQAFLAGLMHDIGQMVLVHGDPVGYANLCDEVQRVGCSITSKEKEAYEFDHALIGLTLLDTWNIDSQIGLAVLNHHSEIAGENSNELATILTVADYLCSKADLGFIVEPAPPTMDMLAKCHLDGEESIGAIVQEIRAAYDEESALFQPA